MTSVFAGQTLREDAPDFVEAVANVLGLSPEEDANFHYAYYSGRDFKEAVKREKANS